MVRVSTHEFGKRALQQQNLTLSAEQQRPNWQVVLMASSVAGFTAAAVTTPLDRIKTALQTQELAPACLVRMKQQQGGSAASAAAAAAACPLEQQQKSVSVRHKTWLQAARTIAQEEGAAGFTRGLVPRILSHTPAVAISWTTYEMAKQTLMQHYA